MSISQCWSWIKFSSRAGNASGQASQRLTSMSQHFLQSLSLLFFSSALIVGVLMPCPISSCKHCKALQGSTDNDFIIIYMAPTRPGVRSRHSGDRLHVPSEHQGLETFAMWLTYSAKYEQTSSFRGCVTSHLFSHQRLDGLLQPFSSRVYDSSRTPRQVEIDFCCPKSKTYLRKRL